MRIAFSHNFLPQLHYVTSKQTTKQTMSGKSNAADDEKRGRISAVVKAAVMSEGVVFAADLIVPNRIESTLLTNS